MHSDNLLKNKKRLLEQLIISKIKDEYPSGKKDDFICINHRVQSIGKIKKLKYINRNYFFVDLNIYNGAQDDLYREYVNIEEISFHIISGNYQSDARYENQNLVISETFKITQKPKLECVEEIFYYQFYEKGKMYRVQSIELARALFYINSDLINLSFQPDALSHLCAIEESNEQFIVSFSNFFLANKNLSSHAHRQRIAWLLFDEEARRSFASIFLKTQHLENNDFSFNFLPPDLTNCQLRFTGYLDDQNEDLFHIKYIEHVELINDKIEKNIIYKTINFHNIEKSFVIKKQENHINRYYADRAYSCFHESIKQLPHYDDGYSVLAINKMNKPQFYESEDEYNLRSKELNLANCYYFSQLRCNDFSIFIISLKRSIKNENKKSIFRIFCFEKSRESLFYPMVRQFFYYLRQKENFKWNDHCNAYESIVINRDTGRNIPFTDDEFYSHCAQILHQKIQDLLNTSKFRLLNKAILDEQVNTVKTENLSEHYPIICLESVTIPDQIKKMIEFSDSEKLSILIAFAINAKGQRELLGFWFNDSQDENPASTSLAITELKKRGLASAALIFHNAIENLQIERLRSELPVVRLQTCFSHLVSKISFDKSDDKTRVARYMQGLYTSKTKDEAIKALQRLSKYLPYNMNYKDSLDAIDSLFALPSLSRGVLFEAHSSIAEINIALRKEMSLLNFCSSIEALNRVIYVAIQAVSREWGEPIANWDKKITELLDSVPKPEC